MELLLDNHLDEVGERLIDLHNLLLGLIIFRSVFLFRRTSLRDYTDDKQHKNSLQSSWGDKKIVYPCEFRASYCSLQIDNQMMSSDRKTVLSS